MACWWVWNHQVDLGAHTREEVEDFTGCIPLFLKKCVVKDGEKDKINLKTKFFGQIFAEATAFEMNLQDECRKNTGKLRQYAAVVLPIKFR